MVVAATNAWTFACVVTLCITGVILAGIFLLWEAINGEDSGDSDQI